MATTSTMEEDPIKSSAGVIPLDLPRMKVEVYTKCAECQQRGLTQSYKWLAEISHAMK